MGWIIAMEADGLGPGDLSPLVSVCLAWIVSEELSFASPTPTTNVLPGLAWRDSAIFVVLVDSLHSTQTF